MLLENQHKRQFMSFRTKLFFIFLITGLSLSAQDDKDKKRDIGTEVVNVVKPYTPSVSDAFKVKQVPTLTDSVTTAKKEIKYTIFSVPVASTFVPAKAKPSAVKKAKKEDLFNTYASVGLGNFSTAVVDFYTSRALARNETLDLSLNHHSSQGGIEGVVLDDNFFNTALEGNYRKKSRYLEWGADAGFKHQIFNWYGVPEQAAFTNAELGAVDERQSYYTAFLGANLSLKDSYYKEGSLMLQRFWDGNESSEIRAYLTPVFEIPISGELITTKVTIDYLGGDFNTSYASDDSISYSNLLLGVTPNLVVLRDDLTVNLGASIFYAKEEENSTLFIYPNITASYRLVDEYVIAFGGIEGKPIQNSYSNFVSNNPFVSPTLLVRPTDQQYDAYVGVKGKLIANVGYHVKASYTAANNQPLFKANYVNAFSNPDAGYAYGNSFDVVYDDVKTISVFGELKVDVNRDFTFRLQGEIFEYTTDVEAEAWNLPTVQGSLLADYQISPKWSAGLSIFYTGERSDVFTPDPTDTGAPLAPELVTLKSFFDVNARLSYQFDKQLSAFLRLNNLGANEYARWANYPVQGFQVLAGAAYKFDL
jgi:hypothetical protein